MLDDRGFFSFFRLTCKWIYEHRNAINSSMIQSFLLWYSTSASSCDDSVCFEYVTLGFSIITKQSWAGRGRLSWWLRFKRESSRGFDRNLCRSRVPASMSWYEDAVSKWAPIFPLKSNERARTIRFWWWFVGCGLDAVVPHLTASSKTGLVRVTMVNNIILMSSCSPLFSLWWFVGWWFGC